MGGQLRRAAFYFIWYRGLSTTSSVIPYVCFIVRIRSDWIVARGIIQVAAVRAAVLSYQDPTGTLLGSNWAPTEQAQRADAIGILLGSDWDSLARWADAIGILLRSY